MLPYSKHKIEKDEIATVTEALESDWLTTEPITAADIRRVVHELKVIGDQAYNQHQTAA